MEAFELILVIVLAVLVVALFLISYLKKKKFNTELNQIREELKAGDKVMTDSGMVGEVVESFEDGEYKYFVLKSGKGEHVGYVTVHANAIYYAFDKEAKQQESTTVVVRPAENQQKPEDEEE